MNNQTSYRVIKYLQNSQLNKEDKKIIIKFFSKAKSSTSLFLAPILENDSDFENMFIEYLKTREISDIKNIEKQIISLLGKKKYV